MTVNLVQFIERALPGQSHFSCCRSLKGVVKGLVKNIRAVGRVEKRMAAGKVNKKFSAKHEKKAPGGKTKCVAGIKNNETCKRRNTGKRDIVSLINKTKYILTSVDSAETQCLTRPEK